MKDVYTMKELNTFREGGAAFSGLESAQKFFETYVHNIDDSERAFLWLNEEVGELARIIRTENKERYKDGIGDILMWLFSLSKILDIKISHALEYSTQQIVAKGYTKLTATGEIDKPLDMD